MTHMKGKKEVKQGNNKCAKPEIIHAEETEKHKTKGLIRGDR